MAVPVLAATGTRLATGARVNSLVPVPAGVAAGDIVLVSIYLESTTAVTPPAEFTALTFTTSPQTTTNVSIQRVFWKRATTADSGTYTFTHASATTNAVAARYTGAIATGTPLEVLGSATSGGTAVTTSPAVSGTTTGADRLLVLTTTNYNAGTWTTPSGWTGGLTTTELAFFTAGQPTAGATASVTAANPTSGRMTATLVGIIPAATATPPATGRAIPTTGLVARYEARNETGKTDGTALPQLTDTVGGLHAVQATTANQPTYRTGAVNGQPAYEFDGVSDAAVAPVALNAVPALTLTVVISSGASEATSRVFPATLSNAGGSTIFAIAEGATPGEWGTYMVSPPQQQSQVEAATSGVNTTAWQVLTLTVSAGAYVLYVNGTPARSGNLDFNTTTFTTTQFALGSIFSAPFSGRIAMAAVWTSGLSAADRAQVHSYAQDVYGITVTDYVAPPSTSVNLARVGTATIGGLRVGTATPSAAYVGSTLIWQP